MTQAKTTKTKRSVMRTAPAARKSRSNTASAKKKRTILVTGYPGFIGKCLVRKLIETEPHSNYFLLVQEKFVKDAQKYIRSLTHKKLNNVNILTGDIADMHLGLSSDELQLLTRKVTDIYHLAAISYLGVPASSMWRVNVQGTVNLLEMAEEMNRLKRFNHVSTCYVSGSREGVITESELDAGQAFRNNYESTKFEAEKKVRKASSSLPISIFRPSIVVGDSKTGEIGRFDGPYYLGMLLASSPVSVPLPLPGKGDAPLHMVPTDYVIDAMYYLSTHPKAVGLTFHIVDPNPLAARSVYELVAARSGKKAPRLRLSAALTKTLLKIPGLEKVSRAHRQAIDYVNTMAFYNSSNTEELLRDSGIHCPRFEEYIDNLMSYVKAIYKAKKREDEAYDPLA
jgi:thioester reductase-like protein